MAAPSAPRWKALAVLVFGACVIGLSPILVRLTDTGPAAAGVWRLGFALPFLALMAGRASAGAGGGVGLPSRLALIAGLMFALDMGFWHYGIRYTSVTNATVLSNLTPVVVTAFAWIFLRQRPRKTFLLAVAVAVAGAWMMALEKGGGPGVNPPLGNALSVLTALWYALYMIAMGEGRKRESASRLMFWSGAVGLPMMLIAALALGEPILPGSAGGWAACVGLGLMHVAGQGSIAWAMGRLPTPTASVVVLVQPVVAAWLGWVLFAEPIGHMQALGAAIALGGVVLAQWASRPKNDPSPEV
ncbi:DMT family transporter [Phenylobacterium deserti]|uniref:EamA/RhaT family transporter n=1 Tax=Phenylobacterium deserti TaxID=1914756 RepID=A0A328AQR2_9CAUL|nr:DMT family transporter [Phenylobacterium deserti]RAK56591.1 EamA/RhaT family transporter [Phenylobacterium deserti]